MAVCSLHLPPCIGLVPNHSPPSSSRSYFSEEGIEYNVLRIPIGGTDCSTRKYTLYDEPQDHSLANFTLAPEDYSLKVIRVTTRAAGRNRG